MGQNLKEIQGKDPTSNKKQSHPHFKQGIISCKRKNQRIYQEKLPIWSNCYSFGRFEV